jgi:hypothetical protein
MVWVAFKMLTGDRSMYPAIVFGVTFACFLIAVLVRARKVLAGQLVDVFIDTGPPGPGRERA